MNRVTSSKKVSMVGFIKTSGNTEPGEPLWEPGERPPTIGQPITEYKVNGTDKVKMSGSRYDLPYEGAGLGG